MSYNVDVIKIKRWLTFAEAALYLGLAQETVRKKVTKRDIPPSALSIGIDAQGKNVKYIDKEWLDRKLLENRLDDGTEYIS